MPDLSRRTFVWSSALAAAFGFSGKVAVPAAFAQGPAVPAKGFHKYKVGSAEVTALYDGVWIKPHDPAFIKNASVEETKAALGKAGLPTENVTVPLTVIVLAVNGKHIMIDAGSGAQWQPTAQGVRGTMQAAGIDPARIDTVLISHFHPDHIFGLMEKDTNTPVYPNAELVVTADEYKWWTEPGRVEKLPEARRALGQRISAVFPTWKNFTLVDREKEVAPGIQLLKAPGHTPGHAVFLLSSGNQQLMLSNDVAYVPALLAPHPEWQGAYDQDGPLAIASRRKMLDRAVADKLRVCGAHFPFPGSGVFAKDGGAYAFVPDTV
jgi:glyoxylase-like metal-dependent hydrolase (beta-lactamase superfamily II)